MNIWIAVKAKLGDPPVKNGAADGVFFCVKRKKPTCSPSWARTEPKRGTNGLSSPASAAKTAWASGSVPRTTSVKVWARAMAWRKVLTGNWYWQGLMAVWLADVRMPFTPRACSFSCCSCGGLVDGKETTWNDEKDRIVLLTFTTAVRVSTTYFFSKGAMDLAS